VSEQSHVANTTTLIVWLDGADGTSAAAGDVDPATSKLVINGSLAHPDGSITAFEVRYCKAFPSYVQRATIDGVVFG
jgi:hypothetical protein